MVCDIPERSPHELMGPFGFRLLNSPVNAKINTLRRMQLRVFQSCILPASSTSITSDSRTAAASGESTWPSSSAWPLLMGDAGRILPGTSSFSWPKIRRSVIAWHLHQPLI